MESLQLQSLERVPLPVLVAEPLPVLQFPEPAAEPVVRALGQTSFLTGEAARLEQFANLTQNVKPHRSPYFVR